MSLAVSRRCIDLAVRSPRAQVGLWKRPVLSGLILGSCRCYASSKVQERAAQGEKKKSMEDIIEDYDVLRVMADRLRFDPWAQPVQTMDLRIPSYKSRKKGASLRDHFSAFTSTVDNWVTNAIHMYRIAKDRAFPGVKVKTAWSWKVFTVQSTSDSAWVAPLRKIAFDTYERLNKAVAERDVKTIKELSIGDMQEHYVKLARNEDPSRVYVWKLHGERSPCRILSVRAVPTHMGASVPNNASRLLIQFLVKFDTLQSLEVYSKKGTLLRGQAEPKPVVEYLVFQKRMWYDSPWAIRDRLHEGLEGEFEKVGQV